MLRNRDPDVRVPGSRRSMERRNRHANDRPRRAVDRERTREHVGAAAEIVPPESIAHDHDGRAARIAALFERESSSHLERTAEHIEVVAAHDLAVQPPRRRAGRRRNMHRDILIARDFAQCRHVRCEPVDRRDRDRAGPAIIRSEVQRDQFALADDAGKGTQQQPVRQIEHCGVRADAERKRERRRRRVAPCARSARAACRTSATRPPITDERGGARCTRTLDAVRKTSDVVNRSVAMIVQRVRQRADHGRAADRGPQQGRLQWTRASPAVGAGRRARSAIRTGVGADSCQLRTGPAARMRETACSADPSARRPVAVSSKSRFDLPPRSGVGSPNRDVR